MVLLCIMELWCPTSWLQGGAELEEVCGDGIYDHLAKHSGHDTDMTPRVAGWSLTLGNSLDHMMHTRPLPRCLQMSCVNIVASQSSTIPCG